MPTSHGGNLANNRPDRCIGTGRDLPCAWRDQSLGRVFALDARTPKNPRHGRADYGTREAPGGRRSAA